MKQLFNRSAHASGGTGRRFFNKREKDALFLAADGRSELSGEPLREDWHADHVVPWSKGGDTNMENAQALNAEENIAKGGSTITPRDWQEEFVNEYRAAALPDFLLCALPGAGKTTASLFIARDFLSAGQGRKLIVVVPTRYLKKQWRDAAFEDFQIVLQTKEFRGTLKGDCRGVAITYDAVAKNALLFKHLCARHECLVVMDEIHHAAEKSSWGTSIQDAFEPAKARLCLSGTPFRSDGKKIPFLTLQPDGQYRVDFHYDYPRALRDDVVRKVSFHRYSGSVTIAQDGEVWDFHTDDDLDDSEAGKRLRGLLQHPTFTGGLLERAHEKLTDVRQLHSNAGGLVVCMNQMHAHNIARLLHQISGEQPDIVVSDEDMNTGNIDTFRTGEKKWLVAVRMVSEGVDIKRLMVVAYLTNVKTPMSFRQTVGRVVRRENDDDVEAYCVMPDDPDLSANARAIEEVQFQILAEEDEDKDPRDPREPGEYTATEDMMVLDSSRPELAGTTITGQNYDAARAEQISIMAKRHRVPESTMAAIWAELGARPEELHQAPTALAVHPEDRQSQLRKQIQKMAARLAYALRGRDGEVKDIHIQYIKEVDETRQQMMTTDQLERKLEWLKDQIAKTRLI